jgi:hypothetical protein
MRNTEVGYKAHLGRWKEVTLTRYAISTLPRSTTISLTYSSLPIPHPLRNFVFGPLDIILGSQQIDMVRVPHAVSDVFASRRCLSGYEGDGPGRAQIVDRRSV